MTQFNDLPVINSSISHSRNIAATANKSSFSLFPFSNSPQRLPHVCQFDPSPPFEPSFATKLCHYVGRYSVRQNHVPLSEVTGCYFAPLLLWSRFCPVIVSDSPG
uniref:(northern house mosquito) hypothetical protein n=1 Tax=Culex pipiens TaxID=7175 RepID=A0A8D8NN47_CULPI